MNIVMFFIRTFIIIVFLNFGLSLNDYENITDISQCKLSHLGLEFFGTISKTESGVRCQNWKTNKPIHKVDESFKDNMFPERSMVNSKNYCRNPNRDPNGPWCYTMDEELIDDTCGIPLCTFNECKLTGPGMDYVGIHNKGTSGQKCLKWNKNRKKVRQKFDTYEQKKFPRHKFPDESIGAAKKYCRNPDGDIGGPWCFVEVEDSDNVVQKEYCDIPFCDDQVCMVFTKNFSTFTHYTSFSKSLTNLTFGIKLWDPDNFFDSHARLLLTLFPLPLTEDEMDDMHIGIEIFISNKDSALTVGSKGSVDYESTLNILTSSKYTFFSLMWGSGFVTLSFEGKAVPIFLAEYKFKKDLFGVHRDSFFYYSLQGSNVLWALPLCDEDDECEMHTTTSENYERYWPLRKKETGHDLQLFVRAFHSAFIVLQASPTVNYPKIKIMLSRSDKKTRITIHEFEGAAENMLKEGELLKLLDYWEWHEFIIMLFAQTMQIFWKRDMGLQLMFEIDNKYISAMRWFSPGSDDCIAHWTFYCSPPESEAPPNPWPPECVLNKDEKDYEGTQWLTSRGHACVPWMDDDGVVSHIGREKALEHWNFCRDPYHEEAGTFCNAMSLKSGKSKEPCGLRLCKSAECRMAGTGNDYIGKLNVTRSNRTCQKWIDNEPHRVKQEYLNETLFADEDVKSAENYCRDPNRNISGPWCYTTDATVPMDLCNVRDCAKQEECIIMTRGNGAGRYMYILPQWKERGVHGGLYFSLKEWDPDLLDGIMFEITPLTGEGWIQLVVGAEKNERVMLFYGKSRDDAELVKDKTLPHLIPAGKWAAFWLQMRQGEIMLGYEGVPDPLFEWHHNDKDSAFEPMFITYMSIEGNIIGVHFKCDECHTERTEIQKFTRIMPLGLWSEIEHVTYNNISFYLRGTGVALIPLILLPGSGEYYGITIGDFKTWVFFIWNGKKALKTLKAVNITVAPFEPDKWTYFTLSYSEYSIEVFRDNVSILQYVHEKPMLFYWFSVGAETGWVTWAANCVPPDIDGPPKDGGWSKWSAWTCTVSCGGGNGFRSRTCSNPSPNIYGKLCDGPPSSTGKCNDFECGDISPKTMDLIRNRLKTQRVSMILDEGSKVVLENDIEILELINEESPNAYFEWTLNGVYVSTKPDQIEFVNNDIVIYETATSDTGVYICMLHRINKKRIVLKVISLAVTPKTYSLVTRATYDLTLDSNAVVLGYVYSDLSQKWMLNDSVYIDYGITTLAAVNTEYIRVLNLSHNGLWQCIIEQDDLQLMWVTNIVKLNVMRAPNLLSHLMEDEFTAPIFARLGKEIYVLLALISIIITVFLLVFLVLYAYLKWCTLPQRIYPDNKTLKK